MTLVMTLPLPAAPRASESDRGLAARLRRRDESALAEAYDQHAGAVYGTLLRMLDAASAQEVTQDVFLRLWQRPEAFDPDRAGLRAYLLVMARSRALDRVRAQRPTVPLHDEERPLDVPDDAPGPQRRGEDAQTREALRRHLSRLSAAHRETVERAYLRGESREEIARHMNVPVGTVKSRLNHALKALRAHLNGEVDAWLE